MLEKRNKLDMQQCGFRKQRSTVYSIIHLEAEVKTALVNKEHFVAVFLDISKRSTTHGNIE